MRKICWYSYIGCLVLRRSKRGILISVFQNRCASNGKVKRISKAGDNQSSDGRADERKAHADGEVLLSVRLVPASPPASY